MTDATAAAIAGELALLDPVVRADRHAASKLIDPEFLEVGQASSIWRDSIEGWRVMFHQGTRID